MSDREAPLEAETWLGATHPVGSVPLVLFVPSQDRDGLEIDHELWVTRALDAFGQLFRGATAYPRARGVWRDDTQGGKLKHEEPTIITCYADPAVLKHSEAQVALRAFLHRLGRETNQGEVGIVIDGQYYGIAKFDPAVGP